MSHNKIFLLLMLLASSATYAMHQSDQYPMEQSSFAKATADRQQVVQQEEPNTWGYRLLKTLINWLEKKRDNAITSAQKKAEQKQLEQYIKTEDKDLRELVAHSNITPALTFAMLAGNVAFMFTNMRRGTHCNFRKPTTVASIAGSVFCIGNLMRHYRNSSLIYDYAKLKVSHSLHNSLTVMDRTTTITTLQHVKKMLERNIKTNQIFSTLNTLGKDGALVTLGATIPMILDRCRCHPCPKLFGIQLATNGIIAFINGRTQATRNERIKKELAQINNMLTMITKLPRQDSVQSNIYPAVQNPTQNNDNSFVQSQPSAPVFAQNEESFGLRQNIETYN